MCGICGIFSSRNLANNSEIISEMNDVLHHRGPDDSGIYIDENIALGHKRLSIIDLSKAGHQPFTSDDGNFILTFNGEIYNFRDLRTILIGLGYKFKTQTDTEVLLKSYMHWGEKAVEKLNGMFSFAIWNKKNKELFIARDRYGIKPLYFFKTEDYFVFASEIKSILKFPLYSKNLDKEALFE